LTPEGKDKWHGIYEPERYIVFLGFQNSKKSDLTILKIAGKHGGQDNRNKSNNNPKYGMIAYPGLHYFDIFIKCLA
jgi:hypothetical protein